MLIKYLLQPERRHLSNRHHRIERDRKRIRKHSVTPLQHSDVPSPIVLLPRSEPEVLEAGVGVGIPPAPELLFEDVGLQGEDDFEVGDGRARYAAGGHLEANVGGGSERLLDDAADVCTTWLRLAREVSDHRGDVTDEVELRA